jgi:lysophospholipase L1-like esterase
LSRDVLEARPRLVIILAGVNDLFQGYPSEWVAGHLRRMYEQAMAAHIQVVACSILPYEGLDALRRERLTGINRWIEEYSAAHGLLFCDLFRAVADPAHPWRLNGSPDGLHPGVAGYRAMGDALASTIERSLLRLSSP